MKLKLILILLALGLTVPAIAADHKAPDLADTWIVVVKDGHYDEFEKALKEHLKFRAKKGDPRAWQTYTPMIGNDLNHYVIRHCCSTYASLDDYAAWGKKAKTGDHWNEKVDPHVASYRHHLVRADIKNSNWPDDVSGYQYFGLTAWDVKSGRGAAVAKSKAAISEAAKSGGWPRHWSWMSQLSGDGNLMLVTPYKNYADMENPDGGFSAFLAKQVGEEKAGSMLKDFSDNFNGSDYTVYRLDKDLSMDE